MPVSRLQGQGERESGGKGKGLKSSGMEPMDLFPTSLNKLGLSFIAQDEDINIMMQPGTFGIAADISLSLDVAYSAMQKSDKVKSCPFIELLSDMLALGVSTAENYILKENPALFTPFLAGEA